MVKKQKTTEGTTHVDTAHPRAQIGHKLGENLKERLQLTARWNSLTPAGSLPEELLLEIFALCVRHSPSYSDPASIFYKWLSVTWVCHRWRRIALGAPALWTNVQMIASPLVKLFLARSREMSLHVTGRVLLSTSTAESVKAWKNIVVALHRVRHLGLDMQPSLGTWDHLTHYRIENPNFRHLESLSIFVRGQIAHSLPRILSDAHDFPSLKTLQLSHVDFATARRFLVPSLKNLVLHEYTIPTVVGSLGWHDFVDGLSGLKNLVSVDITPLPHPPHHPCPSQEQKLILPALRELTVTLPHTAAPSATLLSYLDFTPSKIDFIAGTMHRHKSAPPLYQGAPDDMGYLGIELQKALTKANVAPIRSFRILPTWIWGEEVEFLMYGDEADDASLDPDSSLLGLSIESYTPAAVVEGLVASLPLQHVRYFEIVQLPDEDADSVPIEEASWRLACKNMAEVEVLHIGSLSVQNLLRCVCPPADVEPLFPKLHTIVMDAVDFALEATVIWSQFIKDMLLARVNANRRVKKLIIKSALNFTEAGADELRGLVDTLEWDGEVDITGESDVESDASSFNNRDLADISDEEIETDL